MPSLLDAVRNLILEGEAADHLSRFVGTDRARLDAATNLAVPAMVGGLADRMNEPAGARDIMGLLDADDGAAVDDPVGFITGGDRSRGTGLLASIFGGKADDVISRLGGGSDLGAAGMGRLVPMLAPLVMGLLARRRQAEGLDSAGVAALLADERADLDRRGLLAPAALAGAAAAAGAGAGRVASLEGRRAAAGAGAAAATAANAAGRGRRAGIGWLWWALGGVALVAAAAIGLSQCTGDDSAGTNAGGSVTTAAAGGSDADGDGAAGGSADGDDSDGADSDGADGDGSAQGGDSDGGDSGTATTAQATTTTAPATTATTAPATTATTTATTAPEEGSTINDLLDLDPVTFEVNSAVITPEGQAVLDRAAEFLAANAAVSVEIGGHTDSDGSEAANLALSQARAESVKAYLEGKGIAGDRMTPVGYGETQPKAANDTAENKAINRRIEFTIL